MVAAIVSGHCNMEHPLDHWVECTGRHHGFQPGPDGLLGVRSMGQGAPEIIDAVRASSRADIIVDGPRAWRGRVVVRQWSSARQTSAIRRLGPPVPPRCLGAPTTRVAPVAGS